MEVCTVSIKGCPTKVTLAPAASYAFASKGKIDATVLTSRTIFLARPLFHAQIVGAI